MIEKLPENILEAVLETIPVKIRKNIKNDTDKNIFYYNLPLVP